MKRLRGDMHARELLGLEKGEENPDTKVITYRLSDFQAKSLPREPRSLT